MAGAALCCGRPVHRAERLEETVERRLSAILMADIVGFSRLTEQDEAGTLTRQKAHRADLIDPAFADHGGRIVKTTGDGLLAEFPSVVEAVACAVAIQRAMPDREADRPAEARIVYRVGINLGDVVHEDGDLHGDGVNVSARLEAMADPGGICISGTAFDHLRGKSDIGFEDLGAVQVRNISRPIRAWRVLLDPGQAGQVIAASANKALPRVVLALIPILLIIALAGWWWQSRPDFTPADPAKYAFDLPEKPSIAVLAFDNLSGDPENDFIGDALSETIIATLATLPRMFVIARNSSFSFKGTATPVQVIAEKLGVRFVLEGSIQRSTDTIRVTAQLIDALDGRHLWAKTYDRSLSTVNLLAIQDDITQDIAISMEAELSSGDPAHSFLRDIGDMKTFAIVGQAIEQYRLFTPEGNKVSQEMLLQVLETTPNSASVLVNLAWTHWYNVTFGESTDPAADFAQSREYANRALELDPEFAHAIIMLAWLDAYSLSYDTALQHAQKALEISAGDGTLTSLAAWVYALCGRPERGVNLFRTGMRLEPYSPDWVPFSLAYSLTMLDRYDEAKVIFQSNVENANSTVAAWSTSALAAIAVWEGDNALAREYISGRLRENPELSMAVIKKANYAIRDQAFLSRYYEALRIAGVPENPPSATASGD